MKKIAVLIAFIFLLFRSITIIEAKSESPLETFSNAQNTIPATVFSKSQKIYIRTKANNPGSQTHSIKILDNRYKPLNTYILNKQPVSGFVFSTSFTLPDYSGVFSLEATIQTDGSIDKFVKTITIKDDVSNSVSISINNSVNNNVNVTDNKEDVIEINETESLGVHEISESSSEIPTEGKSVIDNYYININASDKPKSVNGVIDDFVNFITKNVTNFFKRLDKLI